MAPPWRRPNLSPVVKRLLKRLFLCLSPLKVVILVLIVFLLHLRREPSKLAQWLEMSRVALQAELLHGLTCACCLGLLAASFTELLPIPGGLALFGFLLLVTTMGWCSIVKAAELRGLDLVPATVFWPALFRQGQHKDGLWGCAGKEWNCPRPSDSLLGVASSWFWVPSGLLPPVSHVLVRPWALMVQTIRPRMALRLGQTPRSWWEWRELLVGLAFWCAIATSVLHCVRRAQRRRRLHLLPIVLKDIFITLAAFLLTAQPFLWLWSFLLAPLWRLCARLPGLSQVHPGPVHWEEFVALAVLLWLGLRIAYINWYHNTQRLLVTRHLDDLLYALLEPPRMPARPSVDLDFETEAVPVPAPLFGARGDQAAEAEERLQRLRKELLTERQREMQEDVVSVALLPQSLHFFARRKHVLQDALNIFWQCPLSELLAPNMSVSFEGEKGIDAGGLLRDWFDSVGQALTATSTSPLMSECDGLAPQGGDEELTLQDLRSFVALGRFFATALLRGHPLPLHLSSVCCKLLVQAQLSLCDVKSLDPDFCQHRVMPLLERHGLQKLEKALGEHLTFMAAAVWPWPVKELLPGGATRRVYDSDRREYLELLCQERLLGGKLRSYCALQQGFWDVLPLHLLQRSCVSAADLSSMISGSCDPDPQEWRLYSSSCTANRLQKQVVEWFWDAVQTDLNAEQRCRLLRFATGSSRPPPGGFAELRPPFAVEVSPLGSEHHLPTAHTCVNKLVLHSYRSKAQLLEKLLSALVDDTFGTA